MLTFLTKLFFREIFNYYGLRLTAVVSSVTTYFATRDSSDEEEIKGQIVIVNEEHKSKNLNQDILIIIAISLCILIIIGIGIRMFVKWIYRRARDQADIALNNV